MEQLVRQGAERRRIDLGAIFAINALLWLLIWLVVFVVLSL